MTWFQSGSLDNYKPEPRNTFDSSKIFNFSLKYGESAKVVFLNDGGDVTNIRIHRIWGVREHTVNVPCSAPAGKTCPICEVHKRTGNKKLKAEVYYYFSILDLRPYKRQDGTEVPMTRKVFPASPYVLEKVILPKRALLREEYETDFRGCLFRVSRGEETKGMKPPSTGDTMDFLKRVDLESAEYKEHNKPFTPDELLSLLVVDEAEIAQIAADLEAAPAQNTQVAWDKVK
jgi:hypothetical protein